MSATFEPLSVLMSELPFRFVPKGIADELRDSEVAVKMTVSSQDREGAKRDIINNSGGGITGRFHSRRRCTKDRVKRPVLSSRDEQVKNFFIVGVNFSGKTPCSRDPMQCMVFVSPNCSRP
jgi:hypothetical protein